MQKIKAALIHFSLSLLLFSLVMALLVLHWYPLPYFWAEGAWRGVRIAALVDVVLGPLLTLIVYRKGKKSLKLDLGLIALMQISALLWGLHTIYQIRPLFVVFGNIAGQGVLHTVILDEIGGTAKSPDALAKLAKNNPFNPPLVFLRRPPVSQPPDRKELYQLNMSQIYYQDADRYQPYSDNELNAVLDNGLRRKFFDALKARDKKEFERFLAKHNGRFDDYSFVPLHCHFQALILVFDKKQRKVTDYLEITPP